ncbi:hypothetical protein ACIBCN_43735 [Nocardia sp. NPDC051052]|uniref:hypothetical protein n=1 Tax=Nocardia sp. NPDC051052 TaxID=3364322 RepID=UPI0037A1357D
MSNDKPNWELLRQLWDEHMQAPFPPRLRGADVAGVDFVSIDSYTSGCVHTALFHALDDYRRRALAGCIEGLEKILPHIEDGCELEYFERLHKMAVVLSALDEAQTDTRPLC